MTAAQIRRNLLMSGSNLTNFVTRFESAQNGMPRKSRVARKLLTALISGICEAIRGNFFLAVQVHPE